MARGRDLSTRMVRLPTDLERYLIRRLPQMVDYWMREIPFLVILLAVSVIIREDRSWQPAVDLPELILLDSELTRVFNHLTEQVLESRLSVTPARLHRLLSSVVDDVGRGAFTDLTVPLLYHYVYGEARNFSIAHSEGVNVNRLIQLADMLLDQDVERSPSVLGMHGSNACPTCGGARDREGNHSSFEQELTPTSSTSSLASTNLESEGEEGASSLPLFVEIHEDNVHAEFIPLTLNSRVIEPGCSLMPPGLTASGRESPTPSCSTAAAAAESSSSSPPSSSDKGESECENVSAEQLPSLTRARCGICLTGHPDAGLLHHDEIHVVCSACARRIQSLGRTPKCPFCRRKVERVIRVFV